MSGAPSFPAPPAPRRPERGGAYRSLATRDGDATPPATSAPASRPARAGTTPPSELRESLIAAFARAEIDERVDEVFGAVPMALAAGAAVVAVAMGIASLEHRAHGYAGPLALASAALALSAIAYEVARRRGRRSLVVSGGHVGLFRAGVLELVSSTRDLDPPARARRRLAAFALTAIRVPALVLLAGLVGSDRASRTPVASLIATGVVLGLALALASDVWTRLSSASVSVRGRALRVPSWRLDLVREAAVRRGRRA